MAEQTGRASRFEPLSALWRVLAVPQTLLILLGLLALALAASTLIPQIPARYAADPQAWLAMQTGIWAQAGGLLHLLGAFNIAASLWFRALLALLALCVFVRVVDSLELAARIARREPWTQAGLSSWGARPPQVQIPLSLPIDQIRERLDPFLTGQGFSIRTVLDLPVPSIVAVRRGMLFWVRPIAYGSLLFALICIAVSGTWGWQGESWQPREGEVHAIGHDEPYSVRLDSFATVPGDGEQPLEFSSEVAWLDGETVVGQDLLSAGQPSRYAGITLRQVGYVPIVRMRGWDGDNRPLMLETEGDVLSMTGEAEIRFSSEADTPMILVPNEDLFLILSFTQGCDGAGPSLHVRRIGAGGDDGETLGTLRGGGAVTVDDLRFELDLAFGPILRVDFHPAVGLALIGAVLFLVALTVNWLASPRLLWITMAEGQEWPSLVRLVAQPGVGAQTWLSDMAQVFQEALHDDA